MSISTHSDYWYGNTRSNPSHAYLWPVIDAVVADSGFQACRVIDVGCGNGVTAARLAGRGFEVCAVDPSRTGVAQAREAFDDVQFELASAYDPLAESFGRFELVIYLEVVEHLYYPRKLARTLFDLCAEDGTCIISTPYHGYWKNLAIAAAGRMDRHHNPLRDGGHIKFFSMDQLRELLRGAGFSDIRFHRVGRLAPFAKSMVAVCKRHPERI